MRLSVFIDLLVKVSLYCDFFGPEGMGGGGGVRWMGGRRVTSLC